MYSSSPYPSDSSLSMSNSSKINEDSSRTDEDQMENRLGCYDVHYYKINIVLLLSKFDDIIKLYLKGDFQITL